MQSNGLNPGATGSAAQGGGGGKLHAEAHMPSVVPDPFLSAQKHSLPEVRHHAPQTKDEEEVLLQLALQLSRPAQENKASDTADAFAYEGEVFQDEDEECMGCGAEHDDWEPASRIFQYGCGDHWMCLSCTKGPLRGWLAMSCGGSRVSPRPPSHSCCALCFNILSVF